MRSDHQSGGSTKPLTGRKVLAIFVAAFGLIIAVNVVLAYNAVRTFPGLEVPNSYVASQRFDAARAAQEALGWTVSTRMDGDAALRITLRDRSGAPAGARRLAATIGRPTERADDQDLVLRADGPGNYVASVDLAPGRWYLWIDAEARNGAAFRQRLTLIVAEGPGGRG